MKTKVERAAEIHRAMTPHQMALRIVELQDALELADEAVQAKHVASVPKGWRMVPEEPTPEMTQAACDAEYLPLPMWERMRNIYKEMLAAAPKPERVADVPYLDGDPK